MASIFPDGELEHALEVGAVDDRCVRVWVRAPDQKELAVTLSVAGRDPVEAGVELSAEHDWTGVADLTLPVPAPGQPFVVRAGDLSRSGTFAPPPGTSASLTFGVGSCHMPFGKRDGEVVVSGHARGLYPAMTRELRDANARLLLLAGDQIYADELDGFSVRDDLPGSTEHPPALDVALAAYRRLYRGFFNERGFRELRESLPALCMWDDHDIFNNWGSTTLKSPLDAVLFEAASRAYVEYQHARNPGDSAQAPPFGWTHLHGDVGFLALDLRGARDADAGTMIGPQQWAWALDWLNGEAASRVTTLFIVSSVPVAHVSRWFTAATGWIPQRFSGSVRDRWLGRAFLHSRDLLLDTLFAWQTAAPSRQVILLSGDVHAASAFTIRQAEGPGVIKQLVSSAMTTPLVRSQVAFNHLVSRAPNLLEPRYRFERHFVSTTHNFGILQLEPLSSGGHRVTFTVRAWKPSSGGLRTAGRLVSEPPTAAVSP